MRKPMFNSELLDTWLTKKSEEILSKVDSVSISTQEMLVLISKGQHEKFSEIDQSLQNLNQKIDLVETRLENKITNLELKLDQKISDLDSKLEKRFNWSIGIMLALFSGIYLKLFLG